MKKYFKLHLVWCVKVVVWGRYEGGISEMLAEASLRPVPPGSKRDLVLAGVKPIRGGGCASGIT